MTLQNLLDKRLISINQPVSILDVDHPMEQPLHRFNQFSITMITHKIDDNTALEKYGKWKVCYMYTSHAGAPYTDIDIFIKIQKPGNLPKEGE